MQGSTTNTKLDLGSCVRATCLNVDGLRNRDGRMSTLTATPVWRATWWLRVGGVVLLASALGAAHTWRQVRALKAQQRQLDVLVERTSALQAALDTRDFFLQTLAHDLKAPVASVAWHAQLMRRRAREGRLDSSSLEEGLRAIGIGASEAVAAIDELHDLTRLAAGASLPLRCESVDLVALDRRTMNARVELSQRRLHFESSEARLIVDGDPAHLARVLDNAAKYGSPDNPGMVSVERADAEGIAWAVVQVQDYGLGIPRADVPHIFERYHRGQNVALIDGEGLGLASVRRLTELHGGSVEVRSKLGLGSTFTVTLPLSPSTHQECIDEIHPKFVTTVATDTVVRAASLTIVDRGLSVESGQAPPGAWG